MFSTMHNQKKAEQLIVEARNTIESADEHFHKAKEQLQKTIGALDNVRSHFIRKTLAKFRDLFDRIENEKPIELAPVSDQPFAEQLQTLFEKSEVEPVVIENVRGGKGGAFFGSLLAVVITFAVAMIIGAVGSGLSLSPETFTDKYKILHILEWIGGGAWHTTAANPVFGALGLLVALIAVWLITWSILMGKSARRNLKRAEATHEAALRYAEKRQEYAHAIDTLADELARLEKVFETCDIYLQEYNATLRRILHTEGSDYTAYKEVSRSAIDRAAACAQNSVPILNIAIVTSEGTPSTQLKEAIAYGEELVTALIDDAPIPRFDPNAVYHKEEEENEAPIVLPYNGEAKEKEELPTEAGKEENVEEETDRDDSLAIEVQKKS